MIQFLKKIRCRPIYLAVNLANKMLFFIVDYLSRPTVSNTMKRQRVLMVHLICAVTRNISV